MFRCNCPHETRSGCSEPACPYYAKPRDKPQPAPINYDYLGPCGILFNGQPVTNTWVGFGYRK